MDDQNEMRPNVINFLFLVVGKAKNVIFLWGLKISIRNKVQINFSE